VSRARELARRTNDPTVLEPPGPRSPGRKQKGPGAGRAAATSGRMAAMTAMTAEGRTADGSRGAAFSRQRAARSAVLRLHPRPRPRPRPKLGAQKGRRDRERLRGRAPSASGRRQWDTSGERFPARVRVQPDGRLGRLPCRDGLAARGNAPAALEWLAGVEAEHCLVPCRAFEGIASDPRFHDALTVLRAQARRRTLDGRLHARDARLVPGDLAWDAAGKVFLRREPEERKIVRVTAGAAGAPASTSDFAGSSDGDSTPFFGVKIDRRAPSSLGRDGRRPRDGGVPPRGLRALAARRVSISRPARSWAVVAHDEGRRTSSEGFAVDAAGTSGSRTRVGKKSHVLRPGAEELAVARRPVRSSRQGHRGFVDGGAHLGRRPRARILPPRPRDGATTLLDQPPGPGRPDSTAWSFTATPSSASPRP